MIKMTSLDRGLLRDLTEAKADLARHGVVIVRTIETELELTIMAEVKSSMASSPKSMAKMAEGELDDFLESLRRISKKKVDQLRDLYVRLLAKLGTEAPEDLVKELDGIDQLIRWGRISKIVEAVNERLVEKGFASIELTTPETISEGFSVELEQKWPASFDRVKALVRDAATQIAQEEKGEARPPRAKRAARKG